MLVLSLAAGVATAVPACVGSEPSTPSGDDAAIDAAVGADAAPESDVVVADGGGDAKAATPVDSGADAVPSVDAAVDSPVADSAATDPLAAIAGLVLWVRADKGVQTSGDVVTTWLDQSGRGNDFVAGGEGPTLVSEGGAPSVDFDGLQYMVNPSALGIVPGAARTLVVVGSLKSATARSPFLTQDSPSNTGKDDFIIEGNTAATQGQHYGAYMIGNSFDSAQLTSVATLAVHVLRVGALQTGDAILNVSSYRFNGNDSALAVRYGSGNATTVAVPTETLLGAIDLGASGYIYGGVVILEAAVYDRSLSDTETMTVEADLKARHGL